MEKIYTTTIYQFERIEQGDFSRKYIIDENSIRDVHTIYDDDKMVNIETGEKYPILKRKKDSLYLDQNQEIVIGNDYASHMQEYSNNILADKQTCMLYLKAIQMRRKLQSQHEFKQKVKVKK